MEHDTMPMSKDAPPARQVSEKTRLKQYARHLRNEIRKVKALMRRQQTVRDLEIQLANLQEQSKRHPDDRHC